MNKEFKQFEELFDSSPNIAILNIDNGCDDISLFLKEFIVNYDGELTYKDINKISTQTFRLQDRNFEYAVLSNCLSKIPLQEKFINSVYHALENSAFIILIEEKTKSDLSMMMELLDKCNFRAVNSIDIFQNYNLVMAKKLHMWGAGQ